MRSIARVVAIWLALVLMTMPAAAEVVTAGFDATGIQWRRWYGTGCQAHPAFATCRHDGLPQTAAVSAGAIGVPFFPAITPEQIGAVHEATGGRGAASVIDAVGNYDSLFFSMIITAALSLIPIALLFRYSKLLKKPETVQVTEE